MKSLGSMYKKWLLLTLHHVLHGEAVQDGPGCLPPALQQGHHPDPLGPTCTRLDQPQPYFLKNAQNGLKWRENKFLKNDPSAQPI